MELERRLCSALLCWCIVMVVDVVVEDKEGKREIVTYNA